MFTTVLAQGPTPPAAAPAAASTPWWQVLLDNSLFITLLFIFVAAVAAVLIKQRKKDKCLKLFHDYHVSYLTVTGQMIWGDLIVFSKGLELAFDAPYRNTGGMLKTSAMIYEPDLANCLAICRTEEGLTDGEKESRRRQVRRAINPGFHRRAWRSFRNLFNTLNDAFSKAFSTVLGQVAKMKAGPAGPTLTTHKGSVDQIGQTLLGVVGNAYEPILERHIGKPVVLELASPADPDKKPVELHGYLADCTDKYIAIVNTDHHPIELIELEVTESTERPGVRITLEPAYVAITCTAPDPLVIRNVAAGEQQYDLGVVLNNGSTLRLTRPADTSVKLTIERTGHLDIVCPRSQAAVHFGSDPAADNAQLRHPHGLAPESDVEGAQGITASQAESSDE